MKTPAKRYDALGQRVTDCCGCYSTYMDVDPESGEQVLCCKSCYNEVGFGQGDGSEFHPDTNEEEFWERLAKLGHQMPAFFTYPRVGLTTGRQELQDVESVSGTLIHPGMWIAGLLRRAV